MEALEMLSKDVITHDLPRPFVILLDINMPRMNGHEFLLTLRKTDDFKDARVVVFSTSNSKKDVGFAYENNVCGYIVKPNASSDLQDVLKALKGFWSICENPDDTSESSRRAN